MNQAFIKHFNLSESDLTSVKNELRPDQTVFDVLFEKRLVDPDSYLNWAKDFYGLPAIKPDFIAQADGKINELLNRYKNVFPKQIIPFHEWDGVLYVMCLEPLEFQAPQPVQFVLAPYEAIQKYSLQNETKIIAQQDVVMPEQKEFTNPIFKTLAADVATGFTPVQLSDAEPEFPANPEENNEHSTEEAVTAVGLENIESDGAPQGLTNFIVKEENLQEEPATKIFDAPPTLSAPFAAPTAMPTPPPAVEPAAPAENEPEKKPSIPNFTISKIIPQQGPFVETLESLKKYFTQCMVLTFKNGVLSPEVWDDSWYKQPHAQDAIDISNPSIFRIVAETQKPYHGHVIPNSINDSFFQTWNRGQYPQHITICPIISGKNLFGMVLGITTKNVAKDPVKKIQLHHIEEIASNALSAMQTPKAA